MNEVCILCISFPLSKGKSLALIHICPFAYCHMSFWVTFVFFFVYILFHLANLPWHKSVNTPLGNEMAHYL